MKAARSLVLCLLAFLALVPESFGGMVKTHAGQLGHNPLAPAAWGAQEWSLSGANTDNLRANTKQEDSNALINDGFRYRNMETDRFLTEDPAGFIDGLNLFAYVKQNPWTSFDPHGLYVDSETGVWHPDNIADYERGGPPPLGPAGKMAVAAMIVGPLAAAVAPEVVMAIAPRAFTVASSPVAQAAAPVAAMATTNAAVTYDETGSVPAAATSATLTVLSEGTLPRFRFGAPTRTAPGAVSPKPEPLAPPTGTAALDLAKTRSAVAQVDVGTGGGGMKSLPQQQNMAGGSGITWPVNQGFVAGQGGQASVLPGQTLDRYGGTGGRFLSPAGTPAAARSLSPGSEALPLNSYQVMKPFEAGAGRAAPAFGQPGGGAQFYTGRETNVQDLINSGHLAPVPSSTP